MNLLLVSYFILGVKGLADDDYKACWNIPLADGSFCSGAVSTILISHFIFYRLTGPYLKKYIIMLQSKMI